MDEDLFTEILSTLKYFKHKSLIIRSLSSIQLSSSQLKKLQFKDKAKDCYYKIQYEKDLCGSYSIHNAPTLYRLIFDNLINSRNLENCLAICCDYDFKYLKVACLYFLYFKNKDIKFIISGIQLSIKYKFRKLALFGISLAENKVDSYKLEKIKNFLEKNSCKWLELAP